MPMRMGRIQKEQRLWRGRRWLQRLVCRLWRMNLGGQAALRAQLALHCLVSYARANVSSTTIQR